MSTGKTTSPSISSQIKPDLKPKYWMMKTDELTAQLKSTPQGLSQAEAKQRLQKFGPNVLKAKREVTPLGLFLVNSKVQSYLS